MNKYVEQLTKAIAKTENDLILMAMPDKACLSRCSMTEFGQGGKKVFYYDKKPFLELWPVEFETTEDEFGNINIMGNQQYRIIKNENS
jgi:hypothetical protein